MSSGVSIPSGQQLFSPLARALLDGFAEAVVLFDADGHISYANAAGLEVLDRASGGASINTKSLLPRLGRMGGRVERVTAGALGIGHAVYVPVRKAEDTLAERERHAIVETLNSTGWRLTETARRLGISRTTLWRRLREWGIDAPTGQEPEDHLDPELGVE
jgi:lambda repressor-like predicted transcriptional regulator